MNVFDYTPSGWRQGGNPLPFFELAFCKGLSARVFPFPRIRFNNVNGYGELLMQKSTSDFVVARETGYSKVKGLSLSSFKNFFLFLAAFSSSVFAQASALVTEAQTELNGLKGDIFTIGIIIIGIAAAIAVVVLIKRLISRV
jgi:hypothetical protein